MGHLGLLEEHGDHGLKKKTTTQTQKTKNRGWASCWPSLRK